MHEELCEDASLNPCMLRHPCMFIASLGVRGGLGYQAARVTGVLSSFGYGHAGRDVARSPVRCVALRLRSPGRSARCGRRIALSPARHGRWVTRCRRRRAPCVRGAWCAPGRDLAPCAFPAMRGKKIFYKKRNSAMPPCRVGETSTQKYISKDRGTRYTLRCAWYVEAS